MLIIKIFYNPSNYSDKTELWLFLEKLLKIFLLLFIGAGIIAYFLSTYITKSIASISQKIKNVEIGENNERLKWKSNDEIGVLVAAYNEMLTKLELSKEKLAQNERQSAWREMAKQVAHEIKNPLTPMKLSVQHLSRSLETAKKKDKQTIKDFQNNMIQQINLLTEISDEFSNYAELPKGNMREIDLLVIIDKIVSLFKHEKKVKFQINSSDLTTANILGDENQLIRVFNNLIQNSLEAMNAEGSITIDILLNKKFLCVYFKDSGPGVLKEIQPKIFEPQFTTKSKGKGLGLALVWQILLSHKATISLTDSQFGAHFIISFPSYESES
jgi:nitrogen fixation/metabolism regulation signal transduction histidine kinase